MGIRDHRGRVGERGTSLALVGMFLLALVGCASLAVDLGFTYVKHNELQSTADAAALAAISTSDPAAGRTRAFAIVERNMPADRDGSVLTGEDVAYGNWSWEARVFLAGGAPSNAVRVITRRADVNGNPLELFFAPILGHPVTNVAAMAIAARLGGLRFRFLIDDEMIDSDILEIIELAASLGLTPDDIIRDADGDGFIDLPPDTEIELPTGQVGDEALFDIDESFPFTETSSPYSLEDFLNHQDGEGPLPDEVLDPLRGVNRVSDPSMYPVYVNPDVTLVSPVYKSDVSALAPGSVNAKGERRGLLAFNIVGIGDDPDGSGSVLPNLRIRIVDPSTLDLGGVGLTGGAGIALVR